MGCSLACVIKQLSSREQEFIRSLVGGHEREWRSGGLPEWVLRERTRGRLRDNLSQDVLDPSLKMTACL